MGGGCCFTRATLTSRATTAHTGQTTATSKPLGCTVSLGINENSDTGEGPKKRKDHQTFQVYFYSGLLVAATLILIARKMYYMTGSSLGIDRIY